MLVLADPMRDETPEGVLRELYGLTRAEAAMMQALLSGKGLPRAAARLGISPNTAKAHLAQISARPKPAGRAG